MRCVWDVQLQILHIMTATLFMHKQPYCRSTALQRKWIRSVEPHGRRAVLQ